MRQRILKENITKVDMLRMQAVQLPESLSDTELLLCAVLNRLDELEERIDDFEELVAEMNGYELIEEASPSVQR